jgi:hypothetical protein
MATTDIIWGKGWLCLELTGAAGHAGGEVCNVLNPEGEDLIITRAVVYSTHVSTGACTLDIGIGTDAQHDQTELYNGLDIGAMTAYTAKNCFACGDAADACVIWAHDAYLVATGVAASSAGFTGLLYVEYLHSGTCS